MFAEDPPKKQVRENYNLLDLPQPLKRLSSNEAYVRKMLGRCIHLLYADGAGNTAMAKRLAEVSGRKVSQQVVSHWLAGRHAMQPWAADALAVVWDRGAGEMRERFQEMYVQVGSVREAAAYLRKDKEGRSDD